MCCATLWIVRINHININQLHKKRRVVGEFERPLPKDILHLGTEYSSFNGGSVLPSTTNPLPENISLDTSLAINILHNP